MEKCVFINPWNFLKTGSINFVVTVYDNSRNKIDGEVNYEIRDYYSDVVAVGIACAVPKKVIWIFIG